MLGKKCSLAPLKEELKKQGVPKVTYTEFCQGRTMRWALAWSFYDDVIVPSPPSKKRKLEKPRKLLSFTLPEAGLKELQTKASALGCTDSCPVDVVTALLEKSLTDLHVLFKHIPCRKQEQSLFLTAVENTWIHGRQRRREQKRQLRELPRAPQSVNLQNTVVTALPLPSTSVCNTQINAQVACSPEQQGQPQAVISEAKEQTDAGSEHMETSPCTDTSTVKDTCLKEGPTTETNSPSQQPSSPHTNRPFLFRCLLNVMLEEKDVLVEMHWVEGQNKDLMNQLCTFLKNTLLRSVAK